eukprot:gene82-109_t
MTTLKKSHLEASFVLICFQHLSLNKHSYSAMQLTSQLIHQRFAQSGPFVLRSAPLKFLTPTADRDQTVSRRSEPSSRATLMGEQPNPWDLLQPQDVTSRHRGAKPPRRFGRLGEITMALPCGTTGSLYPSFDPARLVSLTVKHPYAIALYARLPFVLRVPLKASVTF